MVELSLSRNKLERVDMKKITECFPSLEVLNLSQNFITKLVDREEKFESKSLKKLILSRNHLTSTDDFKSMHLSSLTILTLFGNSIDCPKDDTIPDDQKHKAATTLLDK